MAEFVKSSELLELIKDCYDAYASVIEKKANATETLKTLYEKACQKEKKHFDKFKENNSGERKTAEEDVSDKSSECFKNYTRKSPDKHIDLPVSLEEIYTGKVRKENLQKKIICSKCQGFSLLGSDKQPPCHSCKGTGTEVIKKVYEVVIKKGMVSGQEIPFIGEADEEPESRPGDLIFVVRIKPHLQFTIAGRKNLSTVVSLPSREVPHVRINTVDGRMIAVDIPKGAKKVEIDNEGLPDYFDHNVKGKLIVVIEQEAPTASESDVENPGFWNSLKSLFGLIK